MQELPDIEQDDFDQHQTAHVHDCRSRLHCVGKAAKPLYLDILQANVFDALAYCDTDIGDFSGLAVEVPLDNTDATKTNVQQKHYKNLLYNSPILMAFDDRLVLENHSEEIFD